MPSRYPNAQLTLLTGSSDGLLRAVQLFPTKMLGVVADHGEFPIERIAVDMGGEGRWVGSVGHEEVLKLTDLEEVFEDGGETGSDGDKDEDNSDNSDGKGGSDDDGEGEQVVEDLPEDLQEILYNTKLSEHFRSFGKDVGVGDAKSLEDVYKSHLENSRKSFSLPTARSSLSPDPLFVLL